MTECTTNATESRQQVVTVFVTEFSAPEMTISLDHLVDVTKKSVEVTKYNNRYHFDDRLVFEKNFGPGHFVVVDPHHFATTRLDIWNLVTPIVFRVSFGRILHSHPTRVMEFPGPTFDSFDCGFRMTASV